MRRLKPELKRALVSGASSGLGKAFAEALHSQGIEVHGMGRSAERLKPVAGVHPVEVDLFEEHNWHEWYSALEASRGGFDILINCAGGAVMGEYGDLQVGDIEKQMRLMLSVPASLSQAAMCAMRERGHGYIVNVASLAGDLPIPYLAPYNACKAGLGTLSRSLMLEHPSEAPWIIDLRPGDYRTPFNQSIVRRSRGKAWESVFFEMLEKHIEAGPETDRVVRDLLCALSRQRHQSIASGSFFQSRIALFFGRCLPWRVFQRFIRNYYQLH